MIALCTVRSGGEDRTEMAEFARARLEFLRGFRKLEHGAPSHDTFRRLFRLLDPEQFRDCFRRLIAAGGLADHEATPIQPRGERCEFLGAITDGSGATVAAVEDDDIGFADITADEGTCDLASRGHGSYSEAFDCLRAFVGDEAALSTHQALPECGQTTVITAGAKPDCETVNLAARRAGRPPGTAHPAEAEPHQSTPSSTDNSEARRALDARGATKQSHSPFRDLAMATLKHHLRAIAATGLQAASPAPIAIAGLQYGRMEPIAVEAGRFRAPRKTGFATV